MTCCRRRPRSRDASGALSSSPIFTRYSGVTDNANRSLMKGVRAPSGCDPCMGSNVIVVSRQIAVASLSSGR